MDDRDQENIEDEPADEGQMAFQPVGAILRAKREADGLSLSEIANRTRVPIRHLEAIEASDYSALPGSTYTIGFTKSYAKALDLDDAAIAANIRAEMEQGGYQGMVARAPAYEPTDPARVPQRWLAWSAAGLAIALIVAYFVWRSFALAPDDLSPQPAKTVAEASIKDRPNQAGGSAIDPAGEVVITAREAAWVKIYDANNKRLYEKEMQVGDRYIVPSDASNPMIVTGRPQVLDISIGGKPVPALGSGERSIADVGVSAAALLARKESPAPSPNSEASTISSGDVSTR